MLSHPILEAGVAKENLMECELMKRHGVVGGKDICLNCPYPKCAFDVHSKRDWERILRRVERQKQLAKRNRIIRKMSANGMLISKIAINNGLSKRQVRRVINGEGVASNADL